MNWLSKTYFLIMVIFVVGCSTDNKQEAELRQAIKQYTAAYNLTDASKLGEYYTQDAVYYYPDSGDTIEGRDAIVQMFKDVFSEEKPHLQLKIDKIEFHGPDRAVETGTSILTFPDKSSEESAYVAENVLEGGKWRIKSVSEITLEAVPAQSEHLQDLAWMIGKWKDTSDEFDIVNDVSWDKYKNFLKQHFTVQVLGVDQLEGTQIIGWDPINKQVRSWIFDSDGGIGEGTWNQADGGWYVNMVYTLSDGRKASAVYVYKKVDENKYVFTSVNRDIDGEVLPDIDPVTFVKVK